MTGGGLSFGLLTPVEVPPPGWSWSTCHENVVVTGARKVIG